MIVARLWGGLGNQMFQYAFGYAKAKELGTSLFLDTRFFTDAYISKNPRFTKQKLNLFKFPIEFKQTVNVNGELRMINRLQNHRISQLLRIPYFSVIPKVDGMTYVKETRMRFQPIICRMRMDAVYYDGYWQTEKYFDKYREHLVSQFTYNSERAEAFVKEKGVNRPNAVAIHMRMGDYGKKHASARYNYVISPTFYKNAIEKAKHYIDNPIFYVFSNDIGKARTLLGNKLEVVFVSAIEDMTDLDEFSIMSKCPNHIISNSTFSWWASWLGNQDGAVNIAPNILFGNKDIIPKRWIRVGI